MNKSGMKKRNVEFESNVEVDSLKDAVWRLTTRVYLLEDFIAERFGEVIGPTGYTKVSSQPPVSRTGKDEGRPQRKRRKGKNVASSEPKVKSVKLPQKSQVQPSTSTTNSSQLDGEEVVGNENICIIKNEVYSDVDLDSDNDEIFPVFTESTNNDIGSENVEEPEDVTFDDDDYDSSENSQDILRRFAQDVGYIKASVNKLEKKVDSLGKGPTGSLEYTDLLTNPVDTLENFELFDKSLATFDKAVLRKWILRSGGDSMTEVIGKLLKRVMTNSVAKQISLRGFKGNFNFSKTNLWKNISDAIMTKENLDPDERKIESAVSEWFRHAGDRLKRETK